MERSCNHAGCEARSALAAGDHASLQCSFVVVFRGVFVVQAGVKAAGRRRRQ
jgi:hypothetical protein